MSQGDEKKVTVSTPEHLAFGEVGGPCSVCTEGSLIEHPRRAALLLCTNCQTVHLSKLRMGEIALVILKAALASDDAETDGPEAWGISESKFFEFLTLIAPKKMAEIAEEADKEFFSPGNLSLILHGASERMKKDEVARTFKVGDCCPKRECKDSRLISHCENEGNFLKCPSCHQIFSCS